MTTIQLLLEPAAAKYLKYYFDENAQTKKVEITGHIRDMIILLLEEAYDPVLKKYKRYISYNAALTSKIEIDITSYLRSAVMHLDKLYVINPKKMYLFNRVIIGMLMSEIIFNCEAKQSVGHKIESAIVDIMIKYDLEETELSLDRVKKAYYRHRIKNHGVIQKKY